MTGFQRIRSVEIDEGFLGGLSISFTDHLNCLIGSRGAGKTTLLEFLRHALVIPSSKPKHLESLVRKNLKAGTIRVVVETAQGQVYTVERTRKGEPKVRNDAGELLSVAPEGILETAAYVYSQAEIEEMAETSTDRLALIDRFAEDDLKEINRALLKVTRELQASAARMLGLSEEESDYEQTEKELAQAVEERRSLGTAQEGGSYEFEQATALKALRGTEARSLEQLGQALTSHQEQVEDLTRQFMEGLTTVIGDEIRTGPNAKLFSTLAATLEKHAAAAKETIADLGHHVAAAEKARAKAAKSLAKQHDKQDTDYDALLRQHKDAREAAQRILDSDEKVARLRSKLQAQEGQRQRFGREDEARRALLRELTELRDQRTEARTRVVETLNRQLEPAGIRVELGEGADTSVFEKAVVSVFHGTKLPSQQSVAQKIAEKLTPAEFAEILLSPKAAELLVEEAGLSQGVAQKVATYLAASSDLYELEITDRPDVPTIYFQDGEESKTTDELSTGQKFTAILPILLLQSDRPLICDEPESHLDQATLVEKVVTPIEHLLGRRQLIFATHNANIVVLGDSGDTQVVVLESDGKASHVAQRGTVDETKDRIGNLLEGGPEAFRERARRYGKPYGS